MNKMQLSKRLSAAADLVGSGSRVVDVGTDHGFVPIYLIEEGKASHVVAMDVNEGPLERARAHVAENGMEDEIELRLSDGLSALNEGEADTMICAGMGGLLMMRIIDEGDPVSKGITHMILQPQSDLYAFRKHLRDLGFTIEEEREIFEDGKYYVAMLVNTCESTFDAYAQATAELTRQGCDADRAMDICHRFGPYLILKKDPVLYDYLQRENAICEKILLKLSEDEHTDRIRDIMSKKNDITFVFEFYGNEVSKD